MPTLQSFNKSTLTIERWYAPKSKMCANCEFVSDKSELFIETVQGETLCIYCDEKGLFICDEHGTVHTHEADCITSPDRLLNGFRYSKATPLEIVNHIYDINESFLPVGAICPKCDSQMENDKCGVCGLVYPF